LEINLFINHGLRVFNLSGVVHDEQNQQYEAVCSGKQ